MQPAARERPAWHRADWSAVWGGAFIFAAIWTVFESLAVAILGITHLGTAIAVWTIVLTIIAMWIAGMETARLAGYSTQHEGIAHGLMMFGVVVMGAMTAMLLSTTILGGTGVHDALAKGVAAGMAWTAFLSLFLGWLAAMVGAASGMGRKKELAKDAVPMRTAA
jgi:hypothetical protein